MGQAERGLQRVALHDRQSLQPVEHRGAELMEAGEGQLHLGLHAGQPGEATSGRAAPQVVQKSGLADARFAAQDQHATLSRAHVLQQPVEHLALLVPTTQRRPRRGLGHRPPRVELARGRLQVRPRARCQTGRWAGTSGSGGISRASGDGVLRVSEIASRSAGRVVLSPGHVMPLRPPRRCARRRGPRPAHARAAEGHRSVRRRRTGRGAAAARVRSPSCGPYRRDGPGPA